MASNFSFLSKDPKYNEIENACIEAEKAVAISNSAAALQTRRALEIAVKWAYSHDGDLTVPYQDNLSSLIHDYDFKEMLDPKLFPRIKFIISLGNRAAHTVQPINRVSAVQSLINLYDFISWIDYSYSTETHDKPFNKTLLSDGADLETKTRKMQEELAAKEEKWEKEKRKLEDRLKSAEERQKTSEKRKENIISKEFHCSDISEYKTRKIYIDHALELAGWSIGTNCREEVEVKGMPNDSGTGFVDYVLYAGNGKPLAVVEAKRTSVDPRKGKIQAKLYADCLEKEHGARPLIFYTNGFETFLWDDTDYPERVTSGFFTKDELDWYFYRKTNKKPIDSVKCRDEIADRPYQKKAVQAVCDSLSNKQRRALLVMATGSGKTRTGVSLVDVLLDNGWIKNILFLADRRELVKQAKKSFAALLPDLSICNLLDGKDDPNSRMVFSTYPTMMNAIDSTKTKDGSRLFTSGHFDLIIIDESHRSIYKKYQDIFTYFDGFLLGLTATPKDDIDKNTYSVFDIEDGVPTFAYELDEAIDNDWLVPFKTIESKTRFMEEGISYDDLSEEEKEEWEDTFDDEIKEVSGDALNKFLFNSDTVDKVLQNLMEQGQKVQGGDVIGKTIIFAKSTKHADFILERFNKLYPDRGKTADVIYNGIKYVDSLIEDFSEANKKPQIAISVDMLDTGIDVPEVLNLVFFKKVRSKAKFWQMIGRGTRLCEDVFGIGIHKKHFIIFDYCGNFEFFRVNKDGFEGRVPKSITENLFNVKVRIAQQLQHFDYHTERYVEHRKKLVTELHGAVSDINEELFSSQLRVEYIHKYKITEAWDSISDEMIRELEEHIAGLINPVEENELAKRFDYFMYTIELAYLMGQPAGKPKTKIIRTAERLSEKGNLPQIKKHEEMIKHIQTDDYWENADIFEHEKVRTALRDLLVLLDKMNTATYYTNFEDEILETRVGEGVDIFVSDLQSYRKKVNAYLKKHQDDIVIYKLRHNKDLTEADIKHLEKLLWEELGSVDDYKEAFGDQPLLKLVAGLVGLDRTSANKLFSKFISDQSLNSKQMEFVNLIVNHVVENGFLDKTILNDHPFNKYGSITNLFEGKIDTVKEIVKRIDELNQRISIG